MLFYFCGIRCTISVSYLILSVCGIMHVTQTCNACLRCVWVHVFVCMCVDGGQRLMLGISFECPLFYLWTNNLSLNPILASQLALLSSVSAFWVLNLHRWVTKSPGFYVGAGGQSFNFHAFVPLFSLSYSQSTWFCSEFGSSLKVQLLISLISPHFLFCLSLL